MNYKRIFFTIFLSLIILIVVIIIFIFWANYRIKNKTRNFLYDDVSQIEHRKVGLVLGTAKYLSSGHENEYFFNRIDAAVELYENNKIDYIIVSGDNSTKDYNESTDMRDELMARGIPEDKIFLDYAGFRTLDSVIRAREIFGQNSYIIISQKFHNERAVFIARKKGIEAYGYNAKDVHMENDKTRIREVFARVKVFYDLLFHVEPKFYGDKIIIP